MTGNKGDIGDNDTKVDLNGTNGDSHKKEEVNKIALKSPVNVVHYVQVLLSTDEEGVNTSLLHSNGHKSPEAALAPQVLAVLVVSLGCLIHGTSVVFGIYAIMGLAKDSSNNTTDNFDEPGGLGFDFDIVRDSSWLSEYTDSIQTVILLTIRLIQM